MPMEIQRLKARLALMDSMLERLDGSAERVQVLKRTVFVLRSILREEEDIRSPYGPVTPIAQFSLQ